MQEVNVREICWHAGDSVYHVRVASSSDLLCDEFAI